MTQRTQQLQASKLVVKLLFFMFIGFLVEFIIWQILGSFISFGGAYLIKILLASFIGSTVSTRVMFWQINNRMINKSY